MPRSRPTPLEPSWRYAVADRQPTPYPFRHGRRTRDPRYNVVESRQPTPHPLAERSYPSWVQDAVSDRQSMPHPLEQARHPHDSKRHARILSRPRETQARHGEAVRPSPKRRPAYSSSTQHLVDMHNAEIDNRPALPRTERAVTKSEKRVKFKLPSVPLRSRADSIMSRMMESLSLEDATPRRCRECGQRVD